MDYKKKYLKYKLKYLNLKKGGMNFDEVDDLINKINEHYYNHLTQSEQRIHDLELGDLGDLDVTSQVYDSVKDMTEEDKMLSKLDNMYLFYNEKKKSLEKEITILENFQNNVLRPKYTIIINKFPSKKDEINKLYEALLKRNDQQILDCHKKIEIMDSFLKQITMIKNEIIKNKNTS